MHELSIAQSLIELASETAEREGATKVNVLHLRIGALAGVVAEALRFSFDLAAEGTACEGATLEIEHVPIAVRCPQCQAAKVIAGHFCFVCPDCGSPTADVLQGQELDLISLEVEAHATASP